ncbi:MAG: phosphate signaling complex PhoU family protein [Pseudonocardiaceae bacterium]
MLARRSQSVPEGRGVVCHTYHCPPAGTWTFFYAELDSVVEGVAVIARRAAEMMADASTALVYADVRIAEWVISGDGELQAMCDELDQRCSKLLLLQAPVAADLRVIITAMRAVGDLGRMVHLAQHIAKIARLKHPRVLIPDDIRSILTQMSMRAVSLAQDAAAAIESRDQLSGERLAQTDDEIDALRRQLFPILFSQEWSHGVELAVDAALIGRYYERFADHAVTIAGQVSQLPSHGLSPQR